MLMRDFSEVNFTVVACQKKFGLNFLIGFVVDGLVVDDLLIDYFDNFDARLTPDAIVYLSVEKYILLNRYSDVRVDSDGRLYKLDQDKKYRLVENVDNGESFLKIDRNNDSL